MPKPDPLAEQNHPPQYRFRGHISPQEAEQKGIRSEVTAVKQGNIAVVRLYDVIDSWGGYWGISAKEIIAALDEVGEVETIQLRINSPGGDAFEGIAIYNALVAHDARVEVVVDSLAASAASIVAQAGDSVEMMNGSQMMVHDASGICIGNADDMSKMKATLDHVSDNIASVYSERAGGTTAAWRQVMKNETWYSASEAVEAGLATKVSKKKAKSGDDEPKAAFDLSVFNYAGRDNAPAPTLDTNILKARASVRDSSTETQENDRMAKTETPTPEPAPANDPVEPTTPQPEESETETPEVAPDSGGEQDPAKPQTPAAAPETVVVDKVTFEGLQAKLSTLEAKQAHKEQEDAVKDRDAFLAKAMADGKFAPAQLKGYQAFMDANPQAARLMVDGLAKNSVPVEEIGSGETDGQPQDDLAYPTLFLTEGEKQSIQDAYAGVQ